MTARVKDVPSAVNKSLAVLDTGFNLLRRKATEVMVWVLTNKNRDLGSEVPCSVPIAYGLKDYKLTSMAMRKATEDVLTTCENKGLRILTLYADGQWINLMTRDASDNP